MPFGKGKVMIQKLGGSVSERGDLEQAVAAVLSVTWRIPNETARSWLEATLGTKWDGRSIVISHHAPSVVGTAARFMAIVQPVLSFLSWGT